MIRLIAALGFLLCCVVVSNQAFGHCDTLQGPVVKAAQAALAAGDPKLVLHWVRPQDEAAITDAFQQAMEIRALGPRARNLADRFFFETLVRIHRAGEGAPYTGLDERDPEPIIEATDEALARGSTTELERELSEAVKAGLAQRFAAARAAKDFRPGEVAAGRRFVAAYVSLTHWVEAVHAAAVGEGTHHGGAAGQDAGEHAAIHPAEGHAPAAARLLPWLLAALMTVIAGLEAALLLRSRRRGTA